MQYLRPRSVTELMKMKRETSLPILAGGTDLMAQWSTGKKPSGVIDISGIDEIRRIYDEGMFIRIGALCTHSQIMSDREVVRSVNVLAKACATIGARQIQNRGTIGGNVMNASPAGDTLPVLLALGARVVIETHHNAREVNFGEFFTDYRKTVVAKHEVVSAFRVPKLGAKTLADFYKIGTRRAQAISKVMACFIAQRSGNALRDIRLAFGSVAPVPVRALATEIFLNEKKLSAGVITEAISILNTELHPIDDIRSTAAYRLHAAGALLKKFLQAVIAK